LRKGIPCLCRRCERGMGAVSRRRGPSKHSNLLSVHQSKQIPDVVVPHRNVVNNKLSQCRSIYQFPADG
jgi:hypothetical protein